MIRLKRPTAPILALAALWFAVFAGLAPSPASATQNCLQVPAVSPLSGLSLVNDVNAASLSLANLNAGSAALTDGGACLSTLAGVLWHDTGTNTLKIRDQADSSWIVVGYFDETGKTFTPNINGAQFFATDTGSANAYAVAPTPAWTAYKAGQIVYFIAANANTGASTINVSTLGNKALVRRDGTASQAGDIVAGAVYAGIYDGTSVRVLAPYIPVASTSAAGVIPIATQATTNAGTDNTSAVTASDLAGQRFEIIFSGVTANGGNATIAHGLGVIPKRVQLYIHCTTAEGGYSVGDEVLVPNYYYNGSSFVGAAVFIHGSSYVGYWVGNSITIPNISTGSSFTINFAHWSFAVRAWAN